MVKQDRSSMDFSGFYIRKEEQPAEERAGLRPYVTEFMGEKKPVEERTEETDGPDFKRIVKFLGGDPDKIPQKYLIDQ